MKSQRASGTAQNPHAKKFGRAIVMGASMAGMWTARALMDHFEEVVLLERDHLSDEPGYRSGVPQNRQYHTLLESGLQQMKEWFPGLDEELIAAGAVPYDVTGDIRLGIANYWFPQFRSGSVLLSCSRMLLESSIRRRLCQHPCIHFVEGVEVIGLQGDEGDRRVTGVWTRPRRAMPDQQESRLLHTGDLVVDALGRRSQTPEWLEKMGYLAPKESEVDSFLGYVTRRYKRKPGLPMMLIAALAPDHPYTGLVFPEENDTMVAFMGGYNKHYPPTDPREFEAFAGNLGPEFQEALKRAEPLSQPYGYRGTSSRWRHYEQLERWPERFVVLGDAFCGFNPVYGQGMSVAAMSAAALARQVKNSGENLDGLARRTLREISKITESAWLLATSADLEWPGTEGGTLGNGPADRFARWYIKKLLEATLFDQKVRLAFIAVSQLVKPGTSLLAPDILLRVMKQTLLGKLGRKT